MKRSAQVTILVALLLLPRYGSSSAQTGNPPVTPLQNAGKLSGTAVELDPVQGWIAVRTVHGKVTRLQLDPEARGQLKNIKPGDKVLLSLAIEAKAVQPNEGDRGAGAKPEPPNGMGKLSGKVLRFDHKERFIDIATPEGGVNRIELDKEAENQLKDIKPGDFVTAILTLEATSVEPKD